MTSMDKMKVIDCIKYGPPEVLRLTEADIPVPKADEVLVEVKASAVTASDLFIRGLEIPFRLKLMIRLFFGFTRPRRTALGLVFSGTVKSTGSNVSRFSPGDEVYGMTGFRLGAYAEYTCVKEKDSTVGCIALKPKNVSFEEATAAVYGGSLALQYMDMGEIQKGQRIVVYGASGTSGTIAVQYGKYLGAHVTAVCSGRNIDFVKSLGADTVLDYTVTDTVEEGVKFDFVLDSVGGWKTSKLKESCRRALKDRKKYISIDDGPLKLDSQRLMLIKKLTEEGHIKPVLDKIFSMEEIVEAHRYVEGGHKRGGVAVRIG